MNQYEISKKKLRYLNFFWIGFIIYTLGSTFSVTGRLDIKVCQAIQILGLALMFGTVSHLIQFKFNNNFLRFFYTIYFGWLLGIVFRDFDNILNYSFLKEFLFGSGMLYLSSLIMLLPVNFTYIKKFFDIIFILGIFYLMLNLLFIKDLIYGGGNSNAKGMVEVFADLSFSNGFILLTFNYHNKKKQALAIIVILLTILMATINARRGLLLMSTNMALISFIIYTYFSKNKFKIFYFSILAALIATLYVANMYKAYDNKIFGSILGRGTEDTRSNVEIYFYDDMKTNDWIIGRGINGQYFCPGVEENQLTNYRINIETGYLQTILKGGLISLGLFLIIAIPGIVKGLFYSKNILSKAAGIWILMALINSYPTIYEGFTLKYLLVWVCIGICYNREIRKIKEIDLKNIFMELPETKFY